MSFTQFCRKFYFKTTGYSYTNLGRMFIRLFVGVMMMQFGVRGIIDHAQLSPAETHWLWGAEGLPLTIYIIEITCSFFIMIGFLTRIMIVPLFVLMIIFCSCGFHAPLSMQVSAAESVVPFLFLGIYFFLLLVGPGKISVDYFFALYLIDKEDGNEIYELEEV